MRIDTVLGALVLMAPLAFITDSAFADNESIAIEGSSCQKISPDESIASARVRASDAAAFEAIEKLPVIKNYRNQYDAQSFATKIYKLVDNHLDQLNTSTLKQTDDEVCIKISANLSVSSIRKSFFTKSETEIAKKTTEDSDFTIDLPPKPNIVVNEDIAYQSESSSKELSEEMVPESSSEELSKQPVEDTPSYNPSTKDITRKKLPPKETTSVFVDRTEFFDGNSTTKFFEYLKKDIEQIDGVTATDISDNPAYILKTKVLKAKVDRINSSTNRLQVVISLSLSNTANMETFTEHQNRFILFNSSEDAQKTAAALIKKLLTTGLMKLTPHIKSHSVSTSGNSILTPRN